MGQGKTGGDKIAKQIIPFKIVGEQKELSMLGRVYSAILKICGMHDDTAETTISIALHEKVFGAERVHQNHCRHSVNKRSVSIMPFSFICLFR